MKDNVWLRVPTAEIAKEAAESLERCLSQLGEDAEGVRVVLIAVSPEGYVGVTGNLSSEDQIDLMRFATTQKEIGETREFAVDLRGR